MSIKGVIWVTQISSLFDLELRTPSLVCAKNLWFSLRSKRSSAWQMEQSSNDPSVSAIAPRPRVCRR